MYVNLFPHKQLQRSKRFMLVLGLFLITGGAYAFSRELFLSGTFRAGWAISSVCILAAGIGLYFLGSGRIITKDAYFSMNQERLKYRMAVFAREMEITWKEIDFLEITVHTIVFHLVSGDSINMRLGNIQQPEVALHVSRSIHLAALEKGIAVNGVQPDNKTVAAEA